MIAALTFAACLALGPGSAEILTRDLSPAWPALAAVDPDTPVAPAPLPGVPRVFHPQELRQMAARWRIDAIPSHPLCVARSVRTLDPSRLIEAMHWAWPAASIELLDFSRQPAPDGPLEFPRSALRREAGAALWPGWVTYAPNRRFRIWARVRIAENAVRVVALADLEPGRPVKESQVSAVTRPQFPSDEPYARTLGEVVGRWPRRPIAAGTALRTDQLAEPRVVAMGDTVEVEVRDGGAVLKLETIAESAGAVGETVTVRNPLSGRLLRARVTAYGKATLGSGAGTIRHAPENNDHGRKPES